VLGLGVLGACRSGKTEIEAGAVLVQIKAASASQVPDELRVWAYDDTGRLWDGARIPAQGKLAPKSAQELGSVLLQPGTLVGKLRIHAQGLLGGTRILDGTLEVAPTDTRRTFDLVLDSAVLADADGDGVPDVFDDCLPKANPQQGGCAPNPGPDSGVASPADAAVESTASGRDGQPASDVGPWRDGASQLPDELPYDDGPSWTGDAPVESLEAWDAPAELPADARGTGDSWPGGDDVYRAADGGPDAWDALKPDALAEVLGDSRAAQDVSDMAKLFDLGLDRPADLPVSLPDADESCGELGQCNLPQGALCSVDGECASGACADGVCCTNTCLGPCRSCNQPTVTGTCQFYAAGSNPEAECVGGATCNGVGACGPPPPPNLPNGQLCNLGSQCATGFCVDGVCCNSKCDQPCYACGTGICQVVRRTEDIPQCSNGQTCDRKGNCI
jgi:hypothetical protein